MTFLPHRTMLTRRHLFVLVAGLVCTGILGGCSRSNPGGEESAAGPLPIGDAACATCGMVVVQQPAPRAQLIHRDGARAFFCSLSDAVVYASNPSGHGKPTAIFVETLDPRADPGKTDAAARPWAPVQSVSFVAGIERAGVMGKPALAYAARDEAEQVAKRFGGTVVSWAELQERLP
ncbi:nitrous oxide reductase accessory protein NosL [Candidatus Binatia bacterium]|nr:nitrous oxide reductase accessory protein NosL [Candidatus Binatia bacterium]